VVRKVELGDRSIFMILSSKNTVHVKHVRSQSASIQTMGTFYDQDILRIIRDFTRLRPAYYSLTESANCFRKIELDDGDIMIILSSAGPIDINGVSGGNDSVFIAGQMSPENVVSVLHLCGIQVNATKLSEVYMLLSKVCCSFLRLQVNGSNLNEQKI
jgi:hypothetical protein